ncbi:hypothetical protein F0562_018519 [Nyssa sinensis]|uniref:DUF7865 domain-containing protein n=1 Tax=Nyssa sinensis TaxID=561372 RepID=A0A5J4ZDB9_9ASTE|nr:hypothetical protein F0562_018519 [Nyssa sinensis]
MGPSLFFVICLLHSVIALSSGALMMFYMKEIYTFTHGIETATKLLGSAPHDQLLIRTSDSFSGLLLFAIGFLLFMVAFVKDRDFQVFFAKGSKCGGKSQTQMNGEQCYIIKQCKQTRVFKLR